LGAKSQSGPDQASQRQAPQDQFSQIAAALLALLAPRAAAAQAQTGQQNPLGGLDELFNQFKQSGLEDVIKSWISTGQNQPISPPQLRQALGQERVNDLSQQTGAPQEDLLTQLAKYLPGVVDRLTPNGQLPNTANLPRANRVLSARLTNATRHQGGKSHIGDPHEKYDVAIDNGMCRRQLSPSRPTAKTPG